MTSVIPWLLQTHSSSVTLRATQVVWIQMMVTSDIWYIYEGFLVCIFPSTYQPHESIIWAYITSFVHTYIYRVFSVFITCLIYWSHDYVNLCSLYHFSCMFSDSDLLIYMYLLDLGFTVIFFILLVIFCTCMPGPHHLIMYTCARYAICDAPIRRVRGRHCDVYTQVGNTLTYIAKLHYRQESEAEAQW